jgi:uncharacterized protein YbaR (Trm112 family)
MPANPSSFDSNFVVLSRMLACPACHGELSLKADHVVCAQCARTYPIIDGIPVLISGSETENQKS